MNPVATRPLSATFDEAIARANEELNIAMIAFDSWISNNVGFTQNSPEYKAQKQNIKLIRAHIQELVEKQQLYGGGLKATANKKKYPDGNFTKPRNTPVTCERVGNKLGDRVHQKVSKTDP